MASPPSSTRPAMAPPRQPEPLPAQRKHGLSDQTPTPTPFDKQRPSHGASHRGKNAPIKQAMCRSLILLCLCCLWVCLTVRTATAQPSAASRYVDPIHGIDEPACGTGVGSDACASLAYTLSPAVFPPTGATLWLADGVYTGPLNVNLGLGSAPVRIKSINGPDAVTMDANSTMGYRHFTINTTLSGVSHFTEPSSIEGITLRNGLATLAGSVYVFGNVAYPSQPWSIVL